MMKRKIHNQKGMLCLEERDYDETDKRKDNSEYPILESSGCTADADSIIGGFHFAAAIAGYHSGTLGSKRNA